MRELNENSVILNKWTSTLKELVYGSILLCATTKTRIKNNMKKNHATSCLPSSTETITIDFTRILCCWFHPKRWKEEERRKYLRKSSSLPSVKILNFLSEKIYIFDIFYASSQFTELCIAPDDYFPGPDKVFKKYGSEVRSNKFIKTTTGSFEWETLTPPCRPRLIRLFAVFLPF